MPSQSGMFEKNLKLRNTSEYQDNVLKRFRVSMFKAAGTSYTCLWDNVGGVKFKNFS